jgi:hypothetical protein
MLTSPHRKVIVGLTASTSVTNIHGEPSAEHRTYQRSDLKCGYTAGLGWLGFHKRTNRIGKHFAPVTTAYTDRSCKGKLEWKTQEGGNCTDTAGIETSIQRAVRHRHACTAWVIPNYYIMPW